MSVIDADFPSGDPGLYGLDIARLLDGLYAQTGDFGSTFLADDPDPNVTGTVVGFVIGAGWTGTLRWVLPATNTKVGVARRLWLPNLPSGSSTHYLIQWRNAANGTIGHVRVDTTGRLIVNGGGTEETTTGPVVVANAWQHIEMMMDTAAGEMEVRVNGVVVMQRTGLVIVGPVGQLAVVSTGGNNGDRQYLKDIVWWDGSGTVGNNFLGQVTVFWQRPIATLDAGGWISNAGADADETVNKPRLANVLTASGIISTGNQVRINNTYYNWTSGSVDAGAPAGTAANPWLVAMGGDTVTALANMYAAIGGTGTPGVTYSTALTAHTTATPFGLTETTIAVIPTDGTTVNMTFSETGANTSWLSGSAFLERVHDPIRISADYTPAVKATGSVTFTGLPVADETVTINGQVYVFKAAAVGALEVTIGADADETGTNFAAKVNANSIVVTAINTAGVVALEAISGGTGGNAITLAEAATNTTVSGATLTGGVDTIYPDPVVVQLEPLPDDVTSIRAVIPKLRAAKVDGGDGNVQVSFGISDPSYDAGPDTPITTAFTYWGNPTVPFVSEINPLSAAPWTPGEFNIGARIKVARTL
jgi:hypothetical protein